MSKIHTDSSSTKFPLPNASSEATQQSLLYLRLAALGFVTGLRSTSPLALLNWTKENDSEPISTFDQLLNSPATRLITSTLASGELLADKLPAIPSRISPLPLTGRILLGGIAGFIFSRRYEQPPALGAAVGAVTAAVGSYAGYYARASLLKNTRIPGWILGLLEDGLAYGLGSLAVRGTLWRRK